MIATPSSVAGDGYQPAEQPKERVSSKDENPSVLADVFRENVNIAIWERGLSSDVEKSVARLVASDKSFKLSITLSAEDALASVSESLGTSLDCALSNDIAALVEMFCYLLDVPRAGLRLGVLDAAMCPKFHVDRVPCRLVTTYLGNGTEWLPHDAVDRSKLGVGSNGLPDSESGLFAKPDDIRQLGSGEVALLKGELWDGNENAGLVHRSPAVDAGDARLLLTLDVSR